MKEKEHKDYFDYVKERNITNLKMGAMVAAIAGIIYLLNNVFHFINLKP